MPGTVTTAYVRLTSVLARAAGPETKLLSPGTKGTDFNGSLEASAAPGLNIGDVVRIHAWGAYNNPDASNGSVRVRLYFNPGGALANPIADTVDSVLAANTPSALEWHFFAEFTITGQGRMVDLCVTVFLKM